MDDNLNNKLKKNASTGSYISNKDSNLTKALYTRKLHHSTILFNNNILNKTNHSSAKKKPTAFHQSSLLHIKNNILTKSQSVRDLILDKPKIPHVFKSNNSSNKSILSKETTTKKKLKIQNLILNIKPNDNHIENSTYMSTIYIDKLIQRSKERHKSQAISEITKKTNDRLYYYDHELPALLKKIIHETIKQYDPQINKILKEKGEEILPKIRISYYDRIMDSITKEINIYNQGNKLIKEGIAMNLINEELFGYFNTKSFASKQRNNSFIIKGEIDPAKFFKPKDFSNYKEIKKKKISQKKQINKSEEIKSIIINPDVNDTINLMKKSHESLMSLAIKAEKRLVCHPISPFLNDEERKRMHELFYSRHSIKTSPINQETSNNKSHHVTVNKPYPVLDVYQLKNKDQSFFNKYNQKDRKSKKHIVDKSSTADVDNEDKAGSIIAFERTQFKKKLFDKKDNDIPQTSLRLTIKEEPIHEEKINNIPANTSSINFFTNFNKEKRPIKPTEELSYHDLLKINYDKRKKIEAEELESKKQLQVKQYELNLAKKQIEEKAKAKAIERLFKRAEDYKKYVTSKLREEDLCKKKKPQLTIEKTDVQTNIIDAINEYGLAEKLFKSKKELQIHHRVIKKKIQTKVPFVLQELPSNLKMKINKSLSDDDSYNNSHKDTILKSTPSFELKLQRDIKSILLLTNEQTEKDNQLFKQFREQIENLKKMEGVSYLKYLENKVYNDNEQLEDKDQVFEDERRINAFIKDLNHSLCKTKAKKLSLNSHCIVTDYKFKSTLLD